jgi:predicted dehydrogenase
VGLRVAVVGAGAAGSRHAANLRALGHAVTVVSRRPGVGDAVSLAEAAALRPDAVVVATETSEHVTALAWAVEHGVHAYVEKPLAASPAGLAELLRAADAARLVVATGYNLRFHPALETIASAVGSGRIGRLLSVRAEVGSRLDSWHPGEDPLASYAARRSLGGGALLTLSHELDYVRWIAGEVANSAGIAARTASWPVDVDDVAELVCRHESGAVSSVHMDLVDRSYNRRCRFVGEEGSLAWEWGGPVRLLPDGGELWRDDGFDVGATYVAAVRDFLDAIRDGRPPRASGRDGFRVVELCARVLETVS